ncbi:MAG: hypothetical protein GY913_25195 [Proteobacteria bacterium]|nr:hypothetical protein [Pseudomonadota bacterium]MCP4920210.1 hypothetical protein [Pseudomonadota bacterium]
MTFPDRIGGDLALADLQVVVRGALATNGALLTAGERARAEQILALSGAPGRIYARLATRKSDVFRVPALQYHDVSQGLAGLAELGLVHRGVPWSERLTLRTVVELKDLCRACGLRRGGKRADLVERLAGARDWSDEDVVRVVGKSLVRRLEFLWFRSAWRDRSVMVLERLGQLAPAEYEPTGGGRAFDTRAELLAFEEARGEELEVEQALVALSGSPRRAPHLRGLDVHRMRSRRLAERARELERDKEDALAERIYRVLLAEEARAAFAAWRLAQVLGRSDRAAEGARVCAEWRDRVAPADALRLERTGRRLARAARVGWRPARPLSQAPVRKLRLAAVERIKNRPGWAGLEGEGTTIEGAVAHALSPRRVLFAENLLWTTVFGLLFVDLYFLPVEGMLPVPYLRGPLDLGTPGFRAHRAEAVAERLTAIEAGGGQELARAAFSDRVGQSIAGLAWEVWDEADLLAVVAGTPPAALAAICRRLIDEGWSAAQGLPDLCVLPGEMVRVDAVPARVPEHLLLIEVKGPTDALRDEQRVWHDALRRAGLAIELWSVHT